MENAMTVNFIGAGPGAADLITLRGAKLLGEADVVIYAGSLVNPELLELTKPGAEIHDSAKLTHEQVMDIIVTAEQRGYTTVRLHSGDPSLYGAIHEQIRNLEELGIEYDICPGVSSFSGAAAALGIEYTVPELTQSVVITRMPGRTPVPAAENLAAFAKHGSSMVIFLSTGLLDGLSKQLQAGGRDAEEPAAIVYRATWPDQRVILTTVGNLAQAARDEGISNTALIVTGPCLTDSGNRSRLYAADFTTGFRIAEVTDV
jgi:precorrin-4/cobalt-precorrin-4 C11-methyltransferase